MKKFVLCTTIYDEFVLVESGQVNSRLKEDIDCIVNLKNDYLMPIYAKNGKEEVNRLATFKQIFEILRDGYRVYMQ